MGQVSSAKELNHITEKSAHSFGFITIWYSGEAEECGFFDVVYDSVATAIELSRRILLMFGD